MTLQVIPSSEHPTREELQRLDRLLVVASLDTTVRHQLLVERDETLLTAFGLGQQLRARLVSVQATSLEELAQALLVV